MLAKRRKVVRDMVENVLNDFKRGTGQHWQDLGEPTLLEQAHGYLTAQLKQLTEHTAEHYNDDSQLGAAIHDAVFRAKAVRGWAKGLAALLKLCGDDGDEQVRAGC